MISKKSRGPISKAIMQLCSSTLLGYTNKSKFREGLKEFVDQHQSYLGQIGTAIQAWIMKYASDRKDEIWRLVDDVEPKIRQQYGKWPEPYFRRG